MRRYCAVAQVMTIVGFPVRGAHRKQAFGLLARAALFVPALAQARVSHRSMCKTLSLPESKGISPNHTSKKQTPTAIERCKVSPVSALVGKLAGVGQHACSFLEPTHEILQYRDRARNSGRYRLFAQRCPSVVHRSFWLAFAGQLRLAGEIDGDRVER